MKIEELKKKKIGFVSFGCGKNVTELEKIISKISQFGFEIVADEQLANILIINSCAFLKSSRKETFNVIKEFNKLKNNNLEKIIVTGCLSGYKLDDVENNLEGVDLLLTQDKNSKIVEEIAKLYNVNIKEELNNYSRSLITPKHYAYLKIADGCDNFCSYCTIPYIVGRYKSVEQDYLIKEAKLLAQNGVSELILVAQDITLYGKDLEGDYSLVGLIKELSKINGINRIRLIYCYPENITDEIINEIATNDKVCKYIDIPLQHISNNVLKKMNRKNTKENTITLINKLRKNVKNIGIRSTFIVGFPGETEEDFNELCSFVEKYKLNQLGFFAYSREKGTIAYSLKPQITEAVKKERIAKLAKIQYEVVQQINKKHIGKVYKAVVDEILEDYAVLRADFQLPDLDGRILVYKPKGVAGDYVDVKIESLDGYDLIGVIV